MSDNGGKKTVQYRPYFDDSIDSFSRKPRSAESSFGSKPGPKMKTDDTVGDKKTSYVGDNEVKLAKISPAKDEPITRKNSGKKFGSLGRNLKKFISPSKFEAPPDIPERTSSLKASIGPPVMLSSSSPLPHTFGVLSLDNRVEHNNEDNKSENNNKNHSNNNNICTKNNNDTKIKNEIKIKGSHNGNNSSTFNDENNRNTINRNTINNNNNKSSCSDNNRTDNISEESESYNHINDKDDDSKDYIKNNNNKNTTQDNNTTTNTNSNSNNTATTTTATTTKCQVLAVEFEKPKEEKPKTTFQRDLAKTEQRVKMLVARDAPTFGWAMIRASNRKIESKEKKISLNTEEEILRLKQDHVIKRAESTQEGKMFN